MPTRIKPDYQPSDRVYQLLQPLIGTMERTREFVGHEMGAFMMYWEGCEGKAGTKANWDSTCLNWMRRTLEDKKEAMANNRGFGPQQGNLFQAVAAELIAQDLAPPEKPKRRPVRIQPAVIPGEGETMSAADALEQLAQMRRRPA